MPRYRPDQVFPVQNGAMTMRSASSSLFPGSARAFAVVVLAGLPLAAVGCGSPAVLIGSLPYPGAVAIDGSNAYVTSHALVIHRTAAGKVLMGGDTLFDVPIAGGTSRRLATLAGPAITGIAVRASTVYFTRAGSGTVSSLLPGTPQPHPIASGQQEPWAITVDSTHVYFTTRGTEGHVDGTVVRVPAAGGPLEVIASGLSAPMHLALDETSVYVTILGGPAPDYSASAIVTIPKRGGPPKIVAAELEAVSGFAADGTSIYWASQGSRRADGQVFRLDRAGGRPVVLASGEHSPTDLAVDQAGVFWTCYDGVVRRVGKQGGRPTTIARGQDRPVHIAVSSSAVVWANYGKARGEEDLPGELMALRR